MFLGSAVTDSVVVVVVGLTEYLVPLPDVLSLVPPKNDKKILKVKGQRKLEIHNVEKKIKIYLLLLCSLNI